jgi:hypothetical protein
VTSKKELSRRRLFGLSAPKPQSKFSLEAFYAARTPASEPKVIVPRRPGLQVADVVPTKKGCGK